jgi:2-haloacid dehalogenase
MLASNERRFDAVLFDLLTALLDSWTLWNNIAGDAEAGRNWRAAYLRRTYGAGAYRPYEDLVAEAAVEVGLGPDLTERLAARYSELEPWPEARDVLDRLRRGGVALGIVTNCSEALAATAIGCLGVGFDVVVTAERAGFYKPDPRPYRLALHELGTTAERCLFVAGSAYDLVGTGSVGLPTYWHDRIGMTLPPEASSPILRSPSLHPLIGAVLSAEPRP